MSTLLPQRESLSDAWLDALRHTAAQPRGRAVHVVMTVTGPGSESVEIREHIDTALVAAGEQSVETVANTIFPDALYLSPGYPWGPDLKPEATAALDAAAAALYSRYEDMLPLLRSAPRNRLGTYFSRMISWPGKEPGGTNQLQRRIERVREEFSANRRTNNTLDIDLGADSLEPGAMLPGAQIYSVEDQRTRGFPCLVHIDLTLLDGTLHCAAVYRHHHLITKAYGNLVGLSQLMHFLCEQTGADCGELLVHATLADAEPGHQIKARDLIRQIEAATCPTAAV